MEWYIKVLRQYTDFEGRARRKEFWMFTLFNSIFALSAIIIDNILGITFGGRDIFYGPFYILYGLAVFLPTLAVNVRRLHDIGKSGWYYFIIFIPLAGAIWYIILMVTDSDIGENEYGANPKVNELESDILKTGISDKIQSEGDTKWVTKQIENTDTKPQLPNATFALILGISSILLCPTIILGIINGIITLVISKKPKIMLDQNPEGYSNAKAIKAARITAIIGIILSVLYLPMVLLIVSMDF